MRSLSDRIRHTLLFEIFAVFFAAVLGSWITGHKMNDLGALSLILSLIAMAWNFTFNWLFDKWDMRFRGTAKRTIQIRVIHASLFELGMLLFGLVVVIWYLKIGFVEALIMDIGFAIFFLVYAFVYNWMYDILFPIVRQ